MKLFEKRPLALVLLGFILSSLISALLNIHTSGAWRLFALAPLFALRLDTAQSIATLGMILQGGFSCRSR